MKVKMLEYYQDKLMTLAPDSVVDVDETLGAWLLEHRKAERIAAPKVEEAPALEEQPQRLETPKRGRGAK